MFASAIQTIRNKTINLTDNTIPGLIGMPSQKKWGMIQCGPVTGGNAGQGMLYGFIDLPIAPTRIIEASPIGTYWRYNTDIIQDVSAGIRFPATMTRKEFEPRLKVVARVPSTTGTANTRLGIGLSSNLTLDYLTWPLDVNNNGVMIGWRTADANIQVFRNGGTSIASTTPTIVNTGLVKTTAKRAYEIKYLSAGASCVVTISDPTTTPDTVLYTQTFTTNLPPSGYSNAPTMLLSNAVAVGQDFDIFAAEIEQIL